jgi:hypothetical protein
VVVARPSGAATAGTTGATTVTTSTTTSTSTTIGPGTATRPPDPAGTAEDGGSSRGALSSRAPRLDELLAPSHDRRAAAKVDQRQRTIGALVGGGLTIAVLFGGILGVRERRLVGRRRLPATPGTD